MFYALVPTPLYEAKINQKSGIGHKIFKDLPPWLAACLSKKMATRLKKGGRNRKKKPFSVGEGGRKEGGGSSIFQ
jgi:hypothetical protein